MLHVRFFRSLLVSIGLACRPGWRLARQVVVGPVPARLLTLGLAVALTLFSRRPRLLVTSLQAYTLLMLCRMLMMWLIPLDPPENMILLRDPFLELLVGSGEVLTRDLFFSGHTSLPFLLFLVARERRFRTAFLLLTIAVGSCVILQHVHYTIDVVVAPFVAYGCYRLAVHIRMAAKAW